MKNQRWKAFFEKIKFKYKVSILNENTLEETFHLRLSRLNVFLVLCIFLAITFVINSLVIIKSPLKQFLPGYEGSLDRSELIQNSMLVDSLREEVTLQSIFAQKTSIIASGEIIADSIIPLDSVKLKEREKILMKKSEAENEFCENFEKEEQYNLSVIENKVDKDAKIFFKPLKGIISRKFNPVNNHFGVDIITSGQQSVSSTLAGKIIFTSYTIDEGYVIIVQHEENYTSIYKNNSALLKRMGESVQAGEAIAMAGKNTNKKNETNLHFELWQNGKPLNPQDLIIF